MDDEQLKRHIIAKRLLRRARQVLQKQVDQENLTAFSKATNLAAAIDIFFATEPAPGGSSQDIPPDRVTPGPGPHFVTGVQPEEDKPKIEHVDFPPADMSRNLAANMGQTNNCPECGGSKAIRLLSHATGWPVGPAGVCANSFHGTGVFR